MSILLTALASILVFGVIIFVHEFGHFITAKKSGIKVNEFSLGMGPVILTVTGDETKYSLRMFPIGGFCAMEGEDEDSEDSRAFGKANVWKRILVVSAGAIMNLILGFVILLGLTVGEPSLASRTVAEFSENAVTRENGLMVGDTILAINGRKMYMADDIIYELVRVKDGSADMTVLRDGEKVSLKNVRFETEPDENGTPQLKLDFKVFAARKSVGNVLKYSSLWTVSIARQIFLSFVDLVSGNIPMNELSGPVGIVSIISDATAIGFRSVLIIMAFISINLGVFNVMPLPALDGGRLVFLFFEAIFKRKLNSKYEAAINIAGFVLLMCLMLFVTYNDVSKLFTR